VRRLVIALVAAGVAGVAALAAPTAALAKPDPASVAASASAEDLWRAVRNWRSTKCLEQSWVNGTEQSDVKAADCNGSTQQLWQIHQAQYEIYGFFLENESSGKVLQQRYVYDTEYPEVIVGPETGFVYGHRVWRTR
jgi:hypothetical protein